MKWLDKLERKYGKYAIKNLMYYIIILYIVGFVLTYVNPNNYYKLQLIPKNVINGEYWRLFTFLMIPPSNNLFFVAFVLYFYYLIGNTLESMWGALKFNLYLLTGILGTIAGAMISGQPMGTTYLNLSLFLAFARIYPDFQLYIFFILPVKIKYLAYLDIAFFVVTIAFGTMGDRIAAILALANFLFYFLSTTSRYSPRQVRYRRNYKKEVVSASLNTKRHKCTICGRTEQDDENLEFRYCSKCEGHYEYCSDHLFNHEHIKKN